MDEVDWKNLALYLAECHAATAEHEALLASASNSFKRRQAMICRKAYQVINGDMNLSQPYIYEDSNDTSQRCQKAFEKLESDFKE